MKISTKGRYALRLMLDLAIHTAEGGRVSIRAVAQRQQISEKYLEQIITQLSRASFVRSARGPQGGYSLTRSPEAYTVGEILRQMEGELAPVTCLEAGENQCGRFGQCATVEVYQRIYDAVNSVVDGITLQDLVQIQQEKCAACAP